MPDVHGKAIVGLVVIAFTAISACLR